MKNRYALIIFAVFCCVASFILGNAAQPVFVGGLVTVNNTTSNLTSQAIGHLGFFPGLSYVQHIGLANTNDQVYAWQVSLDQTNYFTVASWRPTVTNATTETVRPTFTNITYYGRITLTTTNNQQGGGTFMFQ